MPPRKLRPLSRDGLVVTEMEHHANLIPWQQLAERTGATLRHSPVDYAGALDLDAAARIVGSRTRDLAFTHASDVLGTINPVAAQGPSHHGAGWLPAQPAAVRGRNAEDLEGGRRARRGRGGQRRRMRCLWSAQRSAQRQNSRLPKSPATASAG
ncbi:aminotransferase class V-fold PLP-dependent enzyme [Pseudarthrobacter sp. PvP090]|uniref:aminotransferase class V-fold PLP-dependent enzyme n=1 Tax=Pseudarthrobacter sp. PvP090 TaxID=3156393 RepID=UPI00339B9853